LLCLLVTYCSHAFFVTQYPRHQHGSTLGRNPTVEGRNPTVERRKPTVEGTKPTDLGRKPTVEKQTGHFHTKYERSRGGVSEARE